MRSNKFVLMALAFQVVIVATMLITAVMPLWTGRDVRLRAFGVDPRDMMRGDHVALDYTIAHIRLSEVTTDVVRGDILRYGDVLYVAYRETDSGAVATGLFRTPPEGQPYLRGISPHFQTVHFSVSLHYGIEEYYTDPETAQHLDTLLRYGKGLTVHTMIDNNGHARIRDIAP